MVISQEVEPDVYVFGSGVEHWVLCNANGRHVVYKDGNPTKTQPIILQGLFHPKNLRAVASSGNVFGFCGRKRYTSLLARGPRHQRCTEKLTSAGCRLAIQPTPTEIGIRKAHQNQRRICRVPKTKLRGEFQIPEDAFHHLPVGGARRSLIPRAEADTELDVRSRRRQVQERANHASSGPPPRRPSPHQAQSMC